MIGKGDYECDIDGEFVARGYLSAMAIKPIRKIKKHMVELSSAGKGDQQPNQHFDANKKNLEGPLSTALSFQTNFSGQLPTETKKSTRGEKTSFTIRSSSLRRKVEQGRPLEDFTLIANSKPLMVVAANMYEHRQLPPRARSIKTPHF